MLITTCDTHGHNATQEEVCFKELSSYSKIVNLRTICAAVGHLKVGDAWAIIDRSGPYAQTVFTDNSLMVTSVGGKMVHYMTCLWRLVLVIGIHRYYCRTRIPSWEDFLLENPTFSS